MYILYFALISMGGASSQGHALYYTEASCETAKEKLLKDFAPEPGRIGQGIVTPKASCVAR